MKKIPFLCVFMIFITVFLTACSPVEHPNILLLSHRLSDISGEDISISDFIITDGKYKLLFEKDDFPVLLTAEGNEKGEIVKVHLSFAKIDEEGKARVPTDAETDFYKEKVFQLLYAFTVDGNESTSRETAEKILPLKSEDFLKTGELTMDKDSFHLVYYSNKICCRFTVTNTYLEKTEITEKPVSVPLYEVTANVVAED